MRSPGEAVAASPRKDQLEGRAAYFVVRRAVALLLSDGSMMEQLNLVPAFACGGLSSAD
jgi:hypothetical protein